MLNVKWERLRQKWETESLLVVWVFDNDIWSTMMLSQMVFYAVQVDWWQVTFTSIYWELGRPTIDWYYNYNFWLHTCKSVTTGWKIHDRPYLLTQFLDLPVASRSSEPSPVAGVTDSFRTVVSIFMHMQGIAVLSTIIRDKAFRRLACWAILSYPHTTLSLQLACIPSPGKGIIATQGFIGYCSIYSFGGFRERNSICVCVIS